jgi:hypothetical protein
LAITNFGRSMAFAEGWSWHRQGIQAAFSKIGFAITVLSGLGLFLFARRILLDCTIALACAVIRPRDPETIFEYGMSAHGHFSDLTGWPYDVCSRRQSALRGWTGRLPSLDVNCNESSEIFTLTPPMAAINPASSACRPVDAASATRASAQRLQVPRQAAQTVHLKSCARAV